MQNLSSVIIIILLGVIAYLWFNPRVDIETKIETVTEVKTVTKIDTMYVEVPIFVEVPISEPTVEDSLNVYRNQVKDEIINGTITTWTTGIVTRQTFDYIPLVPQYITRVDSVFTNTTKTITQTQYPSGLYIGSEFGAVDNRITFSPKLYYMRNKYGIGYRYDILTNSHHIGVLFKL